MTINKNTDLEFSLQQKTEKGVVYTNFYTGDKGSASIRIRLSSNESYLDLTKIDLKPVLFLFHEDDSIFEIKDFINVMPDKGLIQYNLSDNVIAHAGKVKAKLFLRNAEQSVHVANFTFDIKDSGVDGAVAKEIEVEVLEDVIRKVMTDNAMGLLDDEYKEKINQDVVDYVSSNPELYKGPRGSQGIQGERGLRGEQGLKGDKGDALKYADLSISEKEDLKSNITDDAINNFVLKDNSITSDKLKDNTIIPEKTTFFTGTVASEIVDTNNLFNIYTVQTNKTVETNGTIIEDSTRWLSDYIALDSQLSEQLNFTQGSYRIVLYDSNKTFVGRTGIINDTKYISNPATKSKFVRLSGTTALDDMMVNKGSELLPFKPQEDSEEIGPIKIKEEYIPEITENMLEIMEIKVSNNLLNKDTVLTKTTIDTDGSIINDEKRWLSDFISLDSDLGEQINFTQNTYRIGLYDVNKKFISRTGVTNLSSYIPKAGSKVKYVRLSSTNDSTKTMVNKGDKLLPFEEPFGKSTKIKEKYLPEIKEEAKEPDGQLAKIEQNIQTYTPSTPKLEFEEVKTGYDEALWLSADGKRIYGKKGSQLWVSFDECENVIVIIADAKFSIQAVRELDDGELIFSTERDSANRTQNGRVYKTKGFNKETGEIDSYELKVETPSTEAKINNSWGITTYKNIVTLSEYGLRTEEGARRAWLSTDYGETFKVIFDQKETTKLIKGAPEWTETAHMHTCSFDPYWNRIWIVTGDRPNSATYYSDDFGETWKWVDVQFNNDAMQFTGIIALPNCVIFGSDRTPNGLFVYYRGSKSDTPQISPLLLVNDSNVITHVFQLPFKKDWNSLSPVYFSSTSANGTDNKSILVATVDGKKAFVLHENEIDKKFGGRCMAFLGETEQGNIIGTFFDSDISGFRIGKAKAPTWTKM